MVPLHSCTGAAEHYKLSCNFDKSNFAAEHNQAARIQRKVSAAAAVQKLQAQLQWICNSEVIVHSYDTTFVPTFEKSFRVTPGFNCVGLSSDEFGSFGM